MIWRDKKDDVMRKVIQMQGDSNIMKYVLSVSIISTTKKSPPIPLQNTGTLTKLEDVTIIIEREG
jgi:hypothetical protein